MSSSATPPDASPEIWTLTVDRKVFQNQPQLEFTLSGSHPHSASGVSIYGPVTLQKEPAVHFEAFFTEIENLRRTWSNGRRPPMARLGGIGATISKELLPQALLDRLWELQPSVGDYAEPAPRLLVLSREPWIPWQLLALVDPDTKGFGGRFLSEAFALTQWVHNTSWYPHFPLQKIALVAPRDSNLPGVKIERQKLRDWAEKSTRVVEEITPRTDPVLEAMRSSSFDGWHFSSHGLNKGDNPDLWALYLDRDETFLASDLQGAGQVLARHRPLVFLNACYSGRQAFALSGIGGLAKSFLDAGAGAFIGSSWAISDSAATEFSSAFYRHFEAGKPIGEAARWARIQVKNRFDGDPTWLAYTVFAHPSATCVAQPEARDDSESFPEPGPAEIVAPVDEEPPSPELKEKPENPKRKIWPFLLVGALVIALLVFWGTRREAPVASEETGGDAFVPASELGYESKVPLPRPSVAILHFENLGEESYGWLDTAFGEALAQSLEWDGEVRVVDLQDVVKLERDLRLSHPWDLDRQTVEKIRRILGVGFVIAGRFEPSESLSSVELEIQLYGAENGGLLGTWSDEGALRNWCQRVEHVIDGGRTRSEPILREALGAKPLTMPQREVLCRWFPSDFEVMRSYATARRHLDWNRPWPAFDTLSAAETGDTDPLTALTLAEAASNIGSWDIAIAALEGAEAGLEETLAAVPAIADSVPAAIFRSKVEKLWAVIDQEPSKEIELLRERFASYYADDLGRGYRWAEQGSYLAGPDYTLEALPLLRRLPHGDEHPWLDLLESRALLLTSDYRASLDKARLALERTGERGMPWHEARAHIAIAAALREMGGFAEEDLEDHFNEARQLFRELDDPAEEAKAIEVQASIYGNFKRERAEELYFEALEIYRRQGDLSATLRVCYTLRNIVDTDLSQEVACVEELSRTQDAGALSDIAFLEAETAKRLHLAADFEAARIHYESARELFDAARDADLSYLILTNLGELDFLEGRLEEALEKHEKAVEEHEKLSSWWVPYDQYREAVTRAAIGEYTTAKTLHRKALPNSADEYAWAPLEDGETFVEIHLGLAEIDLWSGRASEALDRLETIRDGVETFGDENLVSRLHAIRARAHLQLAKTAEAKRESDEALSAARNAQSSGHRDFRALWGAEIISAELQALSGDTPDAGLRALEELAQRAARVNARGFELEALLALGESQLARGALAKGRCQLLILRERAAGKVAGEPPYPVFVDRAEQVLLRHPDLANSEISAATQLESCRALLGSP